MIQSPLQNESNKLTEYQHGLHVAIIMDGNGRWAIARGRPRLAGHREGATAVRRTVESAPGLGITTLTLYAFSSDNWQRPAREVSALMRLLRAYLRAETARCIEKGVRVSVIGRRDRLAPVILQEIENAERATAHGKTLHLRIAIDYSARHAIMRAAERYAKNGLSDLTRTEFAQLIADSPHSAAPDVDLLIRTGGEQRLSDFLLWECAYAEFYFSRRWWPDFNYEELAQAVNEFTRRDRRFGTVSQAVAG